MERSAIRDKPNYLLNVFIARDFAGATLAAASQGETHWVRSLAAGKRGRKQMEYPGLTLLNDIRAAQKETSLLLREMVEKSKEDNQLFKQIIARLDELSSRVKTLEDRGTQR
jgi:hypothetical protein